MQKVWICHVVCWCSSSVADVFIQKVLWRKIQLFKKGRHCGAKNSVLFELTFKNECVALEINGSSSFLPAGRCGEALLVGLLLLLEKTVTFEANRNVHICLHIWVSLWKIRTCCISPVVKCLVSAEYICR